jgi:hypothetical protein
MAQTFHPSTNTIARVSIFGIVILLGAMLWLVAAISRSSYIPQAGVVREQPVPFSPYAPTGRLPGAEFTTCPISSTSIIAFT